MVVNVDQLDRKLKPLVRKLEADFYKKVQTYEISFVPELETSCKIDIEFTDTSSKILNGDTFNLNVKAVDFLILPFPLIPYSINKKNSFQSKQKKENNYSYNFINKSFSFFLKVKLLRNDVKNFKVIIKPISQKLNSGTQQKQANNQTLAQQIECDLLEIEKNSYQVFFTLKSIERHFVEIYFDNHLINFGTFYIIYFVAY